MTNHTHDPACKTISIDLAYVSVSGHSSSVLASLVIGRTDLLIFAGPQASTIGLTAPTVHLPTSQPGPIFMAEAEF